MTVKVSPLRKYRCLDCDVPVIRSKGGQIYRHETPVADGHAPHVTEAGR